MKNLAILGSTGSIGVNALKVASAHPEKFRVLALSAGKNIELLRHQIEIFKPKAVAVLNESLASNLQENLTGVDLPEILFGPDGFKQLVTMDDVDTIISAITGAAGLMPTYEGIKAGKEIALANKETMVMAGPLVLSEAERQGVSILPIDSEHSAIFQSLQGHRKEDLKRIILTASGGPFRSMTLEQMAQVNAAQALQHPNWEMGPKITIDSATMMNKGLEIIEAKWLFNLQMEQIDVLIHPQSIVHSMVEYEDGSIISQMGIPDMMTPIAYALAYPRHIKTGLPSLELEKVGDLSFEKPDLNRFRCLALALKAAADGESMPAVLNGANEIAVDAFLKGKIGFLDIPKLIEQTMEAHKPHPIDRIDSVMAADKWAREKALAILMTY
ncbi:MAG: 1-deoxy-D-xylulose-5-phosphate reductoisomerase [Deltaproteobacteria bacterium]|nr:1-deoxy-D-xylulose-5-phosphate reductoisomerase [Deltaproteobacteria bacterium]